MPEDTGQTIRIPTNPAIAGHTVRTIVISREQGIKALYDIDDKKIITYLFDKSKGWDMEKAKEWEAAHSKKVVKEFKEIRVDQEKDFLKLCAIYDDGNSEVFEPSRGEPFIIKVNPNHDESGRFSGSGINRNAVPMAPGTKEIPEGYVRRFHVTDEKNVDSVLATGIQMRRAQGVEGPKGIYSWERYEDAKIYAGAKGSAIIEYKEPVGRTHPDVSFQSVIASDIIAVHESWHDIVRDYQADPSARTHPSEWKDLGPDYDKASQYLLGESAEKGGPGSGNFGHAGRPGERGGSGESGGAGGGPGVRGHLETYGSRGPEGPAAAREDAFRAAIVAKDLGLDPGDPKAAETLAAVNYFTQKSYKDIRSVQSGGENSLTPDEKKAVVKEAALIEDYIAAAPKYDEPIYRGIQTTPEAVAAMTRGAVIDMKGTSSWSSRGKVAQTFALDDSNSNPEKVIFVSSNVKSAVAISHLATFPKEREVLVSRKSKFEVSEVRQVIRPRAGDSKNPFRYTVVKLREVAAVGKKFEHLEKSDGLEEILIEYSEESDLTPEEIESDSRIKITNGGEVVYEKIISGKGGPGSGNFGHAGRPGERGGSAEEGSSGGGGGGSAVAVMEPPKQVAAEEARAATQTKLANDFKAKGGIEYHQGDQIYIITRSAKEKGKIQLTFFAKDQKGDLYQTKKDIQFNRPEEAIKHLTENELSARVVKGGPGSGNFGHAGRPGERGGSAEASGGGGGGGSGQIDQTGGGGQSQETLGPKGKVAEQKLNAYIDKWYTDKLDDPKYMVNPDAKQTFKRYQNPDGSFTPERTELHNLIKERFKADHEPVENPVSLMMGGGGAAGKSEAIESGLTKDLVGADHVTVNADDVQNYLPEYQDAIAHGDKLAAARVHEEASIIAKSLLKDVTQNKYNVLLDGTGNGKLKDLQKKIEVMKSGGGTVNAFYMVSPIGEAMDRNIARANKTGRYVPQMVLAGAHIKVARALPPILKSGSFGKMVVGLNRQNKPLRVIATATGSSWKITDKAAWGKVGLRAQIPMNRRMTTDERKI